MKKTLLSSLLLCAFNYSHALSLLDIQSSEKEGKSTLLLTFDEPPHDYNGFTLATPPKLAVDIKGADLKSKKDLSLLTNDFIKKLQIVSTDDRLRLVGGLSQPSSFQMQAINNKLLITLDKPQENGFLALDSTAVSEIQRFDLKRNGNTLKLVFDLSNPNIGLNVLAKNKQLQLDFSNAQLHSSLLNKNYDFTDYGSILKDADFSSLNGKTTLFLNMDNSNYEHTVYQLSNQLIIELKEKKKGFSTDAPVFKGEKLSLNFQNIEIRTVLQVIAEFTGKNIIVSDTVSGNITLKLKNVPWDQALDLILQSRNLDKTENGEVMWVSTRDELKKIQKDKLETQKAIEEAGPIASHVFDLKYQKAEQVKNFFEQGKGKLLSDQGYIIVDERTNKLVIYDVLPKLEQAYQLVEKLDIPVKQVQIEARIVEASDGFSKALGAKLGFGSVRDVRGGKLGIGSTLSGTDGMVSSGVVGSLVGNTQVNLPPSVTGGTATSSFASIFSNSQGDLIGLEIAAQEAESNIKIVSNPRIVTADQIEASIEDGTEIPYEQSTSSGATSVSFKKATLSLKVKPQITSNNDVILTLKVNKDSRGASTSAGPAIDTKQIDTQVLVENGGTVVIGGIYTQEKSETVSKVPFLGDLPVIGFLFRSKYEVNNKKELLVFITPKVLDTDKSLK